jgi:hypothetical protein
MKSLDLVCAPGSDHAPAADSIRWPGTPIVLTRGEPTQITVFNRLSHPLAVHWPATLVMLGPGMTFDFEYRATTLDPVAFEVYTPIVRGNQIALGGETIARIRVVPKARDRRPN